MREILFRGQTRKRGQKVNMARGLIDGHWVYGGIFPGTGDYSIIYGGSSNNISDISPEKYVVYSNTVGQYTGLTDKHGTKIFDGDVVRYNDQADFDIHATVKIGEYAQDGSGGEYKPDKCYGVYFEVIDFTRPDWAEELGVNPHDYNNTISPLDTDVIGIEVIGNIHDNPELL